MNRLLKATLVFLMVAFSLEMIQSAHADYAAIAYSQSTGHWGYAYGYQSRAAAEQAAIMRVPAVDARPVVWVRNGYCALALGDVRGAAGWGWGYSPTVARENALREASMRTPGAHVVITVYSR